MTEENREGKKEKKEPPCVHDIKVEIFQDSIGSFKLQVRATNQHRNPMKSKLVQWLIDKNGFFVLADQKRTDEDGIVQFDFAFSAQEMRVKIICGDCEEIYTFKAPQEKKGKEMPTRFKGTSAWKTFWETLMGRGEK